MNNAFNHILDSIKLLSFNTGMLGLLTLLNVKDIVFLLVGVSSLIYTWIKIIKALRNTDNTNTEVE